MKSQVDMVRQRQNLVSQQSPLFSSTSGNSIWASQLQNLQILQHKLQQQPRVRPQTSSGSSSTSCQSSSQQQSVQFISIHVNNSCNNSSQQQQTEHCYYSSKTANSLLENTEIGSLLSTHRQRETTAMKLIQLRRTCVSILEDDSSTAPAHEEHNLLESRPRLKLAGKIVRQQSTTLPECKVSEESNNQTLSTDGLLGQRRAILKDCYDVLQCKVKEERIRVESEELIVRKYFSVKGDEVSLKTLVFGLVNGVLLSVQGSYKDLANREYIEEANELLRQTNQFKQQAHQLLFTSSFRLTSVLLKVTQFSRHRLSLEFEKLQRVIRKCELGGTSKHNNQLRGTQQNGIGAVTDRTDSSSVSSFFQLLTSGKEQNQEIESNCMNQCNNNNNNSQNSKKQLVNDAIHQIYRQVFRQAKQHVIIQGSDGYINQENKEEKVGLENTKSYEFFNKPSCKDTQNSRQGQNEQEQQEQLYKQSNQHQEHSNIQNNESSSPLSLSGQHKIQQKIPLLIGSLHATSSPNKQKRSASIGAAGNQSSRPQTAASQISQNQSQKKIKKSTEQYQKLNINKTAGVGAISSASVGQNLSGKATKQNQVSSQDNHNNNINTDDDIHSQKKQIIKKSSSFSSSFVDETEISYPVGALESAIIREQQPQKLMSNENLNGRSLRPQTAKQKQTKYKLEQQQKQQEDNFGQKQCTDNQGNVSAEGRLREKSDCEPAATTTTVSNQQLLFQWMSQKNNRVKQTLEQYMKEAVNYKQKVASLMIPLMGLSGSLKTPPSCLDSSQKSFGNYLLAVSPGIDNINKKWINVQFLKNLPNTFSDMSTNPNTLVRQQSSVSQEDLSIPKAEDSSPRKYASPLGNPGTVSISSSNKLPSAGAAATTALFSKNLSSTDSPFNVLQSRPITAQQVHGTLSKSLSLLADIEKTSSSLNQTAKQSKKLQRISAKSKLTLANKPSSAKKATSFMPLPKQSAINPLKKQLKSNHFQAEEIKPNNNAVQTTMNSFKIKSMNSHASLANPIQEIAIRKNTVNLQGNSTESLISVCTTKSNTERYLHNKSRINNPPYFHSSMNPTIDIFPQQQQSEIPILSQNPPQLWRKLSLNFKEFKLN